MSAAESLNRSDQLTLMEEFALLALDDQTGRQLELPGNALGFGLAGATILELSLAGCVDTDLHHLTVVDTAATTDELLKPWLSLFQVAPEPKSVMFWLRELALRREDIHQAAIDRLIGRGILRRDEQRLLWVFKVRRYPTVDGTERIEVRTRLRGLILSRELPAPRDAILLSLIHGCGLSKYLFADLDLDTQKERLEVLARTDLVGREVSAATMASLDMVGQAFSQASLGC
jgi:golgi phosphoprotein 3